MSKSSLPTTLNIDQVLEVVTSFSPADLREFQQRLAAWQSRNGHRLDADEDALIEAATTRLSPVDERRLKRLAARSERGTLSVKEQADYQALARECELADLVRLEAVTELARRRGRSVPEVLAELATKGGGDGR